MITRQCEQHGLTIDDEALQVGRIALGRPYKSEIQILAENGVYLLDRNHPPQDDLDPRIGALEAADQFVDQTAKCSHRHEADLDPAGFSPGRLPRDGLCFVRFAQHVSGTLKKALPGAGELDMGVASSLDELCAEPRFKFLNFVRERGRADSQVCGGAAEMLLLGQCHEVAKQAGLEVCHSL